MAQWDNSVTSNGEQSYSDSSELINESNSIPNWAYCLPDYAILDGNYTNAPDSITKGDKGYISTFLSGADGAFAVNERPSLHIKYDRQKTSEGIIITFNTASGEDYASELTIAWYKGGELLEQETFTPDAVSYLCEHRISVFDEVVITFIRTSKPYRYIWVGSLENRRLTNAGGLKIVYEDVALIASENVVLSSTNMRSESHIRNILNSDIDFPNFAMCYKDYAILNNDFVNVGNDLSEVPYISQSISDENGLFTTNPVMSIDLTGGNYSSVGLTLISNNASQDDYCTELSIEWSRITNGTKTILHTETVYPDSYNYFVYAPVEYYNHIEITFKKTSKPYRPAFLTELLFGLYRIFRDDEAYNVDCNIEVNEISESISSNTLNFSVKTQSPYTFIFQKKQNILIYFDEKLIGKFYLQRGSKRSIWDYDIESQDIIGVLDGNRFDGGVYGGVLASTVIADILQGEDTDWFLDQSFANTRLTGYIPICTKREALQQVAFAIGAIVNSSYDRPLQIYPLPSQITAEFPLSDTFIGLSVDAEEIVTGVRVIAHEYKQTGTERTEVFRGTVASGESVRVEFNQPYYSYQVSPASDVAITTSDNYAVITNSGAEQEITLTGIEYQHQTTAYEKIDPNITAYKNEVEVKDATLVNPANVQAVLDRVYDYYRSNESVSSRVRINEQELGELATIASNFDGTKSGLITALNFIFTRELNADIVIK